jgi:signal transduction histidine kinase
MWRASEQRVSFVNRVSHELGTPLTNMTLNLELASRSLRSQPEMAGRRLEKVSEEISRLGRLVTNVLTHSRKPGDGIQDRLVVCDPDAVILGVLDQFRSALERRAIEIEWTPGETGEQRINSDALSQIVWNLISNVEKYASSGEWLSVSVSQGDGSLRVRVCDRGEGIPSERRAKVFKPFERVSDSTKEGVSGTGLGLSISRELAESMGGSLSLLDAPEMTIFELIIPLQTT